MNADFLLIQRMKQGDEASFDVFVRKYYGEILNYCHYHCFDREYAEDLAQETFLHFFAKLSQYHYMGKTKNYLYTIAGNLCRDFYKKTKDIPIAQEELEKREASGSLDDVLEKLTVEEAVKSLPQDLREVIILYYFQELKIREIADVLQINMSLVKYRLTQAKKKLGQWMGEEEAYESGRKACGL